ncbi:hypothetical protein [Streptomyces axinellae]|uniref:hypothetical protein n=1 Tax=Streptomyces axinellae TaxID=552788 RepID=UPI003CD0668A
MSSSGLIYAVIVGAWAAYLVPMWLRRQDELNEARPTERFSTAIRLLSGKAGMERRYAKDAERREAREARETDDPSVPEARGGAASARSGPAQSEGYDDDAHRREPDAAEEAVDVRGFADPKTKVSALGSEMPTEVRAYRPAERHGRTAGPEADDLRGQRRQETRESEDAHDGRRAGPRRAVRGRQGQPGPHGPLGEHGPAVGRGAGRAAADGAQEPPGSHGPQGPYGEPGAGHERLAREQAAPGAAGETAPSGAEARATALDAQRAKQAKQAKRARLLARRRRTTMLLFLGFTAGAVVAAIGGLALLWAPAVPAVLLSAYIAHLRAQERRRFASAMDRQRAEAAARVLREHGPRGGGSPGSGSPGPSSGPRQAAHHEAETGHESGPGRGGRVTRTGRSTSRDARAGFDAPDEAQNASGDPHGDPYGELRHEAAPDEELQEGRARTRAEEQEAAERRALVEQTDHAEWVDQQRARDRESAEGEGWEPVPVPLPTYVSAPVAPRTTRGVDLEAPDTWSSARSSTAPAAEQAPAPSDRPESEDSPRPRRPRDRNRTPLFDQYEQEERPRAANE